MLPSLRDEEETNDDNFASSNINDNDAAPVFVCGL